VIDRLLGSVGEPDPDLRRGKLWAFRCFVLLHGSVRSVLWLVLGDGLPRAGLAATAAVLAAAAALSLSRRWGPLAPRLALPALGLQLFWTFPLTDNHFFLELYCVALLCVVDRSGEGEALALPALQWLAVLVLFHAGLQKLLHGAYFHGDFLAFMVGRGERFAVPFQLLLPADEIARLASLDPLRTGSGPYRVDALALRVVSNAVYLAELALAPLLVLRRTRVAAALAALALVLAVQLAAREAGFALLFANLLLLFLPSNWCGRLLPGFAALYALALGAALGGLPGGSWIRAGYL
jgi:hypothetical protein